MDRTKRYDSIDCPELDRIDSELAKLESQLDRRAPPKSEPSKPKAPMVDRLFRTLFGRKEGN